MSLSFSQRLIKRRARNTQPGHSPQSRRLHRKQRKENLIDVRSSFLVQRTSSGLDFPKLRSTKLQKSQRLNIPRTFLQGAQILGVCSNETLLVVHNYVRQAVFRLGNLGMLLN